MLKKTIATAVVLAVISSTTLLAATELPAPIKGQMMIPVIVNGLKVLFPDTEPFIDDNGRTMVPVRFVSEKLGGEVKWDAASKVVTITYKSKVITMPLDSKEVTIDGASITLDTSAVLTEGRTMVPLRFVSEAMEATVVWDEPAHAVQVNDAAFTAKVASGEVNLDPWGRLLATNPDPAIVKDWNTLADLPSMAYETIVETVGLADRNNKKYFDVNRNNIFTSRESLDRWSNMIRQYYVTVLNVDYRTINEKTFYDAITPLILDINYSDNLVYYVNLSITNYVKFIKNNHVVIKGYADPEPYLTRQENSLPIIRTHFKFEIIQSDDRTQSILDSYHVSDKSDKIEFKRKTWYTGYSDVRLITTAGNYQEEHMFINVNLENMFLTDQYKYEVLE
ncbi:copper amine oxidase N-terminal domain-containing protein [Paenibacillus psychroresistens]|uniref:Copper amine oxidase N-terminal domain-containing protein n=1 Tax=Paenibacillus psychroresistens TaxID=1778678 RepID=A0A6B8RSD7_9BACL|nr:copper amine oxidase N-terminal domain-containing protein [Paenibacillus psychroresistens]QGQ98817.1 copper amine oxidase N-terminal domain-containing protein [Paenibacillus psychroresistens]